MNQYNLRTLAKLIKLGVFVEQKGELTSLLDNAEQNPLNQSADLRDQLRTASMNIEFPVVYADTFSVYYACIRDGESFIYLGPMATQYLNRVQRHAYYKEMKVDLDLDKNLRLFTLQEVLQAVCLFYSLISGQEIEDMDLVNANHLSTESRDETQKDEIRYDIAEETEEDYRHSYHEERLLLDAVREGNVEEALRRNKEMDVDIGKLSTDDIEHWRNVLVIGATLCARAAIEGGVAPYIAYRISGYYINKGSRSKDVLQILTYRNQAVEELTKAVDEIKRKRHTSSYTEQAKDYIRKHYREKIYLDELAEQMGISSSYLSRLFAKETGEKLQDYIVDIRIEKASNLLIYSDESLSIIAEYVNFPSQSYFGRVFKEKKHMTPKQFRDTYKPTEFIQKG